MFYSACLQLQMLDWSACAILPVHQCRRTSSQVLSRYAPRGFEPASTEANLEIPNDKLIGDLRLASVEAGSKPFEAYLLLKSCVTYAICLLFMFQHSAALGVFTMGHRELLQLASICVTLHPPSQH